MNFILGLLIISYLFFTTKPYFKKQSNSQKLFILLLFVGHFASMGLAYKHTIDIPSNDAFYFYRNALYANSWISLFGVGSTFMSFLIYPLVKSGVSLFVLFFLFSTISYKSFLMIFDEIRKHNTNGIHFFDIPIPQFFFLLPSLHYWSGFLGKDVIVFFILTYLLFEFKKKASIHFLHLLVLLLFLILRPHIFVAVFIATLLYYFTQKDLTKELKIKLSISTLAIVSISVPIIMSFIKIKNLTWDNVIGKWNEINAYALNTGSGIDLSESSYIGKIWLLLFRPLFYDAKTGYQYYISFENSIVLLSVFIISIGLFTNRKQIKIEKDVKMAMLIGICILLLISIYIYNLGLASRMRLMIFPFLFYALHQMYCSHVEKNKVV